MAISVKGIQYSYQIDFFNQVPTHVKSQVHDLPVLSVPEATPADRYTSQNNFVPDNEERFAWAGTRGTPEIQPPLQTDNIESTPLRTGSNVTASPPTLISPILTETSVGEPQLIERRTEAESVVARPASSLSAETGRSFVLPLTELPAPLPSQLPAQDAAPQDEVKAIPKADFQRALRAYRPEAGSFIQPAGYETVDFFRAAYFNTPGTAAEQAALPVASSIKEVNPLSENEAKIQTAESRRPEATTVVTPVPERGAAAEPPRMQPLDSDQTTATAAGNAAVNRLTGENFLARQAQKLYDLVSGAAMLNIGNQVDFRF